MSLELTLDPTEQVRFLNRVSRLVRRLAKKTHFTTKEVEVCLLIYYKLLKDDETNQQYISRVQFGMVFDMVFGISDSVIVGRIYTALDKGATTHVTMETWVQTLSLFLRGTLEEKIKHCYKVYDIVGEKMIRREHMMVLLKDCFIKHHEEEIEETIKDMIDIILRRMDVDRDGAISFDDYRQTVYKYPELMECFGQALPDRSHVYAFSRTFLERVAEF
ncbi:calaxin-like [Toxorhynchites rutilus septentrionalis]|uniref:calaxin-like n=1 Tax=Toxorhynchites rutilus septentrionalis TaxID=329112 RepID=UPI002478D0E9|nr:calaxin-like [Toxorhynchites rutilus septentrionalis]